MSEDTKGSNLTVVPFTVDVEDPNNPPVDVLEPPNSEVVPVVDEPPNKDGFDCPNKEVPVFVAGCDEPKIDVPAVGVL